MKFALSGGTVEFPVNSGQVRLCELLFKMFFISHALLTKKIVTGFTLVDAALTKCTSFIFLYISLAWLTSPPVFLL